MATNVPDHDKTYAIVRDAKAGAITVEDAVARLKGLQDATELTEENFEMADNVTSKEETKEEKEAREVQEKAIENEQSFEGTVDPGKDADADINNIVGVDETDDTTTLRVVPDDQLVSETTEVKDNLVTSKVDESETTTADAAQAKPASEFNEVAPAVGDTADEEPKRKRTKKTDSND